ncbi:hypothetical protein GCM10009118_14440 [Wandonia haliotis]|uniref:Uncharacterized protein n=1 Tax=Wandonia haliotis TaxID=574963 RepID=A0ABN1MPQ9_9FLAO
MKDTRFEIDMNLKLTEISEANFKKLDLPTLFEDKLTDRTFGVVSDGRKEYKLGWLSENIKPVIKWISTELCSIGIDLVFVIFEFTTGRIIKTPSLDYFYYNTEIYNGFIYVITELEIIKINISDLAVVETYSLPDYFESIEFNEVIVVVKCVGDEIVKIE